MLYTNVNRQYQKRAAPVEGKTCCFHHEFCLYTIKQWSVRSCSRQSIINNLLSLRWRFSVSIIVTVIHRRHSAIVRRSYWPWTHHWQLLVEIFSHNHHCNVHHSPHSITLSINESINESTNQSINQRINHGICKSPLYETLRNNTIINNKHGQITQSWAISWPILYICYNVAQ